MRNFGVSCPNCGKSFICELEVGEYTAFCPTCFKSIDVPDSHIKPKPSPNEKKIICRSTRSNSNVKQKTNVQKTNVQKTNVQKTNVQNEIGAMVGFTTIILDPDSVYWRCGLSESTIYYKDIISVQGYENIVNGKITISTAGKNFEANGSSRGLTAVIKELQKRIEIEKNKPSNSSISNVQVVSPADEIRKFKQLADDGIISQDEFEAKKKQLLGL